MKSNIMSNKMEKKTYDKILPTEVGCWFINPSNCINTINHSIWRFPEMGVTPQNHPFVDGFSISSIHFRVTIFWKTPI